MVREVFSITKDELYVNVSGVEGGSLKTLKWRGMHVMKKSLIHVLDELEQGFRPFLGSWGLNFLFQGFGLLCKCQIYSSLSIDVLHWP